MTNCGEGINIYPSASFRFLTNAATSMQKASRINTALYRKHTHTFKLRDTRKLILPLLVSPWCYCVYRRNTNNWTFGYK